MTTTPPALDIDAIRARCEAATPGPLAIEAMYVSAWYTLLAPTIGPIADIFGHADAAFFAAARTDIPALLTALADAQAAAAHWQAEAARQADRAAFLDGEHKQMTAERDALFNVVRVMGDDMTGGDCDCVICQAYNRLPESLRDRLEAE